MGNTVKDSDTLGCFFVALYLSIFLAIIAYLLFSIVAYYV